MENKRSLPDKGYEEYTPWDKRCGPDEGWGYLVFSTQFSTQVTLQGKAPSEVTVSIPEEHRRRGHYVSAFLVELTSAARRPLEVARRGGIVVNFPLTSDTFRSFPMGIGNDPEVTGNENSRWTYIKQHENDKDNENAGSFWLRTECRAREDGNVNRGRDHEGGRCTYEEVCYIPEKVVVQVMPPLTALLESLPQLSLAVDIQVDIDEV